MCKIPNIFIFSKKGGLIMKKATTRIVSLTLAFVLCLGLFSNALAVGDDSSLQESQISEETRGIAISMLSDIEASKEAWGFSDVDFESLNVGAPVHSYIYANDSLEETAKLYPIISDNELLLWVVEHDGSYSLTTELVDEVSNNVDFNEPFSLIYDRYGCYAYAEGSYVMLADYEEDETRSVIALDEAADGVTMTQLADNASLEYTSVSTYANYVYSLSVPFTSQDKSLLCWAACVASIVKHRIGVSYTSTVIAQKYFGPVDYNKGKSPAKIYYILPEYGVNGYCFPVYPSDDSIYKSLNSNYPVYSSWDPTGTELPRHACVIFGINTNTSSLSIMDPDGGVRRTTTYSNKYPSYPHSFYYARFGVTFYLVLGLYHPV